MAWIEIHQELPEHPKTDALMDAIGCERPAAVGHVIMSLLWALRYAHDGIIIPKRLGAIARGAGWIADPDGFASAMVEAGWWDQWGDGWKLHDWDVYAGMLLAKREKDAARKRGGRNAEHPRPVHRTSDGRPSDGSMDGAGTNSTNQHDQHVHVSTDVDEQAGSASPITDDDVLEVVIPEALTFGDGSPAGLLDASQQEHVDDTVRPVKKPRAVRGSAGMDHPVIAALRAEWPTKQSGFPAYERNEGWTDTAKAATRHRLTEEHVPLLLEALRRDKASQKWQDHGGKYIPEPESWLNKRRDNDIRLELERPAGSGLSLLPLQGGDHHPATWDAPPEVRERPWFPSFQPYIGTREGIPGALANWAAEKSSADPSEVVRKLNATKSLLAAGDYVWERMQA